MGGSRKILIATPTPERIYGTPGDAIYSTPYSGKFSMQIIKYNKTTFNL